MSSLHSVSDGLEEDEFFDTLENLHARTGSLGRANAAAHAPERVLGSRSETSQKKEVGRLSVQEGGGRRRATPLPLQQSSLPSTRLSERIALRRSLDEQTFVRRRLSHLFEPESVPTIPAVGGEGATGDWSPIALPKLLLHQSRGSTREHSIVDGSPSTLHQDYDSTSSLTRGPRGGTAPPLHPFESSDGHAFYSDETSPTLASRTSYLTRRQRSSSHQSTSPSAASRVASRMHDLTLAALTAGGTVNEMDRGQEQDLFLQEARDYAPNRQFSSRASFHNKRRSLPADGRVVSAMEDRRPMTSGGLNNARPPSRLGALQSDFGRTLDRQRGMRNDNESLASYNPLDDDATASRTAGLRPRRNTRYTDAPEKQQMSPISPSRNAERMMSPDISSFAGRRSSLGKTNARTARPSQLAAKVLESEGGNSPAESSEPKHSLPESASVDSQTAPSTVWDELDDLKSRIKKLELTGKLPSTSGAAITGSTVPPERPRTATTAPTTIDSSPKQGRKVDGDLQAKVSEVHASAIGGPAAVSIHPLLHSALAKAKPLLNPALYRSLETTAADALQLAVMTGGAGPQGTAYSGASVVNGGFGTDRHVRRKADMMCRNLTDLCLALCDGKLETPSLTGSPLTLDIPSKNNTPGARLPRSSPSRADVQSRAAARPMSRLEARRSSILGVNSTGSPGVPISPRLDIEEASASEQENTPSNTIASQQRRLGRSSSRLTLPRNAAYDNLSGDEDPTLRSVSRAGSDFSFRSKQTLNTRDFTPQSASRSSSLRDTLVKRLTTPTEGHRELTRVGSLSSEGGGRRRWTRDSTPPVLEEESNEQEYQGSIASSQPSQRRRITSLGFKFGSRKASESTLRSVSMGQRARQVLVE